MMGIVEVKGQLTDVAQSGAILNVETFRLDLRVEIGREAVAKLVAEAHCWGGDKHLFGESEEVAQHHLGRCNLLPDDLDDGLRCPTASASKEEKVKLKAVAHLFYGKVVVAVIILLDGVPREPVRVDEHNVEDALPTVCRPDLVPSPRQDGWTDLAKLVGALRTGGNRF
jgi:hypothetical protein